MDIEKKLFEIEIWYKNDLLTTWKQDLSLLKISKFSNGDFLLYVKEYFTFEGITKLTYGFLNLLTEEVIVYDDDFSHKSLKDVTSIDNVYTFKVRAV